MVGEVVDPFLGTMLITPQGEQPLRRPGVDPFWSAFSRWAGEAAPLSSRRYFTRTRAEAYGR